MGQSQEQHMKQIAPSSLRYEADIRLVQFTIELPSSFSSVYQRLIQQIEDYCSKVPDHQLRKYITHCIDQRFSRYNTIDEKAFHQEKSIYDFLIIDQSPFEKREWTDLQNKQTFFKLLRKFHQQYYNQITLSKILEHSDDINDSMISLGEVISLRKPFPFREQNHVILEENLLKRLFYRSYMNVFKSFAGRDREALLRFHSDVGKLLCTIIFRDYFKVEELFELAYCMIYLDKTGLHPHNQFDFLRNKYYSTCLEKKYSIGQGSRRMAEITRAARLYLDQLYLSSLREAEDPQITAPNDALIPARMFPVQRAKDRTAR